METQAMRATCTINPSNWLLLGLVAAVVVLSLAGNSPQEVYSQTAVNQWGTQGGSGNSQFEFPFSISIDPSTGSSFVSDAGNNRIQKFAQGGDFIRAWGTLCVITGFIGCVVEPGQSLGDGQFQYPFGVAVTPITSPITGPRATISSGDIFVADTYNHRIQQFSNTGQFKEKWGGFGRGPSQFNYPFGVAVGPNGDVFVADTYNQRIQRFDAATSRWTIFEAGGQFQYPFGVAVHGKTLYVLDTGSSRVLPFSTDTGSPLPPWGSFGTGPRQFQYPFGIAVGLNGDVFVADTYNQRIKQFSSAGQFKNQWGSFGTGPGQFQYPFGVAVGPVSTGNVFVADTGNDRVQVFAVP
jgi:tripartite motif-containing protein 71